VIAASAGNHAQGVALAAAKLGLPGGVVMPAHTPEMKVRRRDGRGRRGGSAMATLDRPLESPAVEAAGKFKASSPL